MDIFWYNIHATIVGSTEWLKRLVFSKLVVVPGGRIWRLDILELVLTVSENLDVKLGAFFIYSVYVVFLLIEFTD